MTETLYQSETIAHRVARRTRELDEDFDATERQARDAALVMYAEQSFSNGRAGLETSTVPAAGNTNDIIGTTDRNFELREIGAAVSSSMPNERMKPTEPEDGDIVSGTVTTPMISNGRVVITSSDTVRTTLPSQNQDNNGLLPPNFVPQSGPSRKSSGTRSVYSE